MNLNTVIRPGFIYTVEHWRDGRLFGGETVRNLMPTEGVNHVLNVLLKSGAQVGSWYIGINEGNYTPVLTDTAATYPTSATECTTYVEGARVGFVPGTVSGGSVNNSLSRAEFTSNANKTIYGGFITSASAKGATSGVLLSAVKFASPKTFNSGDILRVTAGFTLASV